MKFMNTIFTSFNSSPQTMRGKLPTKVSRRFLIREVLKTRLCIKLRGTCSPFHFPSISLERRTEAVHRWFHPPVYSLHG